MDVRGENEGAGMETMFLSFSQYIHRLTNEFTVTYIHRLRIYSSISESKNISPLYFSVQKNIKKLMNIQCFSIVPPPMPPLSPTNRLPNGEESNPGRVTQSRYRLSHFFGAMNMTCGTVDFLLAVFS
jgi:hypothetical protein